MSVTGHQVSRPTSTPVLAGDRATEGVPMTHVTEARLQTVSNVVRGVLTDVLGIELELDTDASFLELGFDSVSLTKASARLGDLLGIELLAAEMFAYPSIEALSAYLSPRLAHDGSESRSTA